MFTDNFKLKNCELILTLNNYIFCTIKTFIMLFCYILIIHKDSYFFFF